MQQAIKEKKEAYMKGQKTKEKDDKEVFKEKKKNARKEVVKTKKKAREEWVRGREGSEF